MYRINAVFLIASVIGISCNKNIGNLCEEPFVDSTNQTSPSPIIFFRSIEIEEISYKAFAFDEIILGETYDVEKVAVLVHRDSNCINGEVLFQGDIVDMQLYSPSYFYAMDTAGQFRNDFRGIGIYIDKIPVIPSGYKIYRAPCLCSDGKVVRIVPK